MVMTVYGKRNKLEFLDSPLSQKLNEIINNHSLSIEEKQYKIERLGILE